jgi:uncharacterized membrane protein YhhN
MQKTRKFILLVFWFCTLTDLYAIATGNEKLHMIFKPSLMLCLLIALLCTSPAAKGKGMMITAILFSLLGDIYLMLENRDPLFFILGLVSFLLAHIFYILFFLRSKEKAPSLLSQKPWLAGLLFLYVAGLLALVLPSAGDLVIPVTVYAVVLSGMLLSSLHVYNRFDKQSGIRFVLGALFFVLSDSLLAINKFYSPLGGASLLIMLTYCVAQFLIVSGYMRISSIPQKTTDGVY